MENTSATKSEWYSNVLCLGMLACLSGCLGDENTPAAEGGGEVPVALRTDLQAILDDSVAHGITPGANLHISVGDGQTWTAASGIGDLQEHTAMAPEEQFRAGSIVKTFVATAVLQAVEAGALQLDDLLTDRLPAEVTTRIPNAAKISIDMLLAHRSGIADWDTADVDEAVGTDPTHVYLLDEIIDRTAKLPVVFQPGERYGYSNTNYILLGEILAGISGRSWRDVLREQVFAKAGLEHTSLPEVGDLSCPAPCAHGYVSVGDEMLDLTHVDPSMAGPSGGHALITTTKDLSRFFQKLRSGALFQHPSTLESMFAFQAAADPELRQIGYGFGVMQMDSNGNTAIGHLGGTAGYMSFMLYVPATDRYVTGFINVMGDLGAVLEPIIARVATP